MFREACFGDERYIPDYVLGYSLGLLAGLIDRMGRLDGVEEIHSSRSSRKGASGAVLEAKIWILLINASKMKGYRVRMAHYECVISYLYTHDALGLVSTSSRRGSMRANPKPPCRFHTHAPLTPSTTPPTLHQGERER